jgi:hypothetical protein
MALAQAKKPTLLFAALGLLLCATWLALRLNSSSLDYWPLVLRDGGKSNLIAGEPRFIRSDEWAIWLPMVFNQMRATPAFAAVNPSLGEGNIPFIASLPSYEFATLFRPQLWGYMLFNESLGLSWQYLYKWAGCILSALALLIRLSATKNRSLAIALCGAISLTFSDMLQWWFSTTLPESVIATNFIIVGALLWHRARTRARSVLACLLSCYFALHLALVFYPPFQISLVYFGLLIVGAHIATTPFPTEERKFKLATATTCSLGLVAIICYLFFEHSETIRILSSSPYPGRREFDHAGINFSRYFSAFFGFAFTEFNTPKDINRPELSSIIMVWPILSLALLSADFRRRIGTHKVVVITLAASVGLISALGIPFGLEKWTGLSMVQPTRFLLCSGLMGWAAFFAVCSSQHEPYSTFEVSKLLPRAAGLMAFFALLGSQIKFDLLPNLTLEDFIIGTTIWTVFGLLFLLRYYQPLALGVALWSLTCNLLVNPLTSNTDQLLGSPFATFVQTEVKQHPAAKWLVLNQLGVAQAARANGAHVLNGAHYTPPLTWLKLLDPSGQYSPIYGSYARIEVEHAKDLTAPVFTKTAADEYLIRLDICDNWLQKLGVDYLVVARYTNSSFPDCIGEWSKQNFGELLETYHRPEAAKEFSNP